MKNEHIDIFELIEEVAEKNNASHVVKFLKQLVHEQSESNWKRPYSPDWCLHQSHSKSTERLDVKFNRIRNPSQNK